MKKKLNSDELEKISPTLHMVSCTKKSFWANHPNFITGVLVVDFIFFGIVAVLLPSFLYKGTWLIWVFSAPIVLYIGSLLLTQGLGLLILLLKFFKWIILLIRRRLN
jgi:hypothetical protein